jgi:hypothetical protein
MLKSDATLTSVQEVSQGKFLATFVLADDTGLTLTIPCTPQEAEKLEVSGKYNVAVTAQK